MNPNIHTRGRRASGLALSIAALLFSSAAAATQDDRGVMDTLQVHGFVSQGFIITDDNNFFGPSSGGGGSLKFTEVGVNASLRPLPNTLVSGQVLSRRAGDEGEDAVPRLDHGVLDYQFLSDENRSAGIQLGRFKNPFGFHNQTRDVAFTRPGILLPQSIYFDRTRSLGLAADGGSAYLSQRLASGDLRVQVGVGRPQAGRDLAQVLVLDEQPGSIDGRTSAIGQILYEHDGGRFVAALSAARVRARFNSRSSGPGDGDFEFEPYILSLQYNSEDWSLTGEFALRKSSLSGFQDEQSARNFDVTGESGYLQYTRRFLADWQWFLRYDVLYLDRDDRDGRDFAEATQLPAHSRFAKDLTAGVQWRFHPQVLLSAEYHRVDGTGWLPGADNPDPGATERRWNMLLLQTSLRF